MINTTLKRAVIYCRVSTKEQVEEGNSLVTQEKACRDYALKYGYSVACVFIEQGESAKTAERTELKKLFSYCSLKKNGINAVLAYKIDRISRNTDDYSQIRLLLKRYGVEIKSTTEYFEDTPAGRFMENIIANVAQFDNDVRTERSVGGMKGAIREGRYVWMAPLGYSNVRVDGKATIAANEKAHLIRTIFEEVAKGKESIEEIRLKLTKKGLCSKNGNPIAKSFFYKILHNEVYIAIIQKFGERHAGTFLPIISQELYDRVQSVLNSKRPRKVYKINNPDFPLRRFTKSESGETLTGAWSKGKYSYYGYYYFQTTKKLFRKERLEELFISLLNSFAISKKHADYLESKLKNYLKTKQSNTNDINKNYDAKESELKKKKELIIEKNLKGILSDTTTRDMLQEIENKLWEIQGNRNIIHTESVFPTKIFKELNLLLTNPGNYWKSKLFLTKLKLQEFSFPKGIILENMKLRTPEICSILKVKETILRNFSSLVTYSKPYPKQKDLQGSSHCTKHEEIMIYETLINDLKRFEEILTTEKENSNTPI